ncbi:cytosolic sulfotransferase 15-like [Mercurialis annua]|uniref:cytosolic sulfotransferase 15-like n=1 Tax=Mercurialis annua TaxID=3986 RepID=UPI00215E60C5|nr:cytosolic sulfotransferase 15-like [Mercurialis annua]
MAEDLHHLNSQDHDLQVDQLLHSLPKAQGWMAAGLTLYQHFWCPSKVLGNVISFQANFQAQEQDILLASMPKSGTTWLKSLIFSIVNRTRFSFSNTPLLTITPHELVPFLEFTLFANKDLHNDLSIIPSPRLFATHIPYPALPETIQHSSNCRIVYICRNPLDTVVSSWHFFSETMAQAKATTNQLSIDEFFDLSFKGFVGFGPFWDHVLGYWKASLEKPEKVLFLKYEDLKEDIVSHLKRLAEFIGHPFSPDEERQGMIEEIAKLCSLSSLKELEVNKNGKFMPSFQNKAYFRKGEVGDWKNYLTPEKKKHFESVMIEKLGDSGLSFKLCN